MNWSSAYSFATAFASRVKDSCIRVEIAGSVRRRCREVKDIEIVAIPRYESEQQSLFGGSPSLVSLLWRKVSAMKQSGIVEPLKPGSSDHTTDSKWQAKGGVDDRYYRLWLPQAKVQIDLFVATPDNFGMVYLVRTGSADFSKAVAAFWKRRGGSMDGCQLFSSDGARLIARTEREAFAQLGVEYVDPSSRIGRGNVRPEQIKKSAPERRFSTYGLG